MTGRFEQALTEMRKSKKGRKGKMPKNFSVSSGDKSKAGGLTKKGVKRYRAANPGSKLKTAVTTKPSKLKKGSKSAKRRKSFCKRMGGMKKKLTSKKTARNPDSRINKALRKWNCSTDVNPNALQAMSEAVHFRVFESQIDERVISLIECAVDSIDQVTDEMIEDAFIVESILTPILFEELNNPLNESVEDFDNIVLKRFDEKVNPAALKIPAGYGGQAPSFTRGIKQGIYDAGSKVSKGIGRGIYNAGRRVTKDLAGAGYQGVKNVYQGLSGDTPIGTRIGKTLRGGLSGLRRGFSKEGTPEGEGGGIGAATGRGLRRGARAIKSGIGKAFQAYKDTQTKPFGGEMTRRPQKPAPEKPEMINKEAFKSNQRRKAADRRQGVIKDKATGRRMIPTIPTRGNPDAVRRARQTNQDIMQGAVKKAARASFEPTPKIPSDAAAQAARAPAGIFRTELGQKVDDFRRRLAGERGSSFSPKNPIARQYSQREPATFTGARDTNFRNARSSYFSPPRLKR